MTGPRTKKEESPKPEAKMFPIRLDHNYRPASLKFQVMEEKIDEDGNRTMTPVETIGEKEVRDKNDKIRQAASGHYGKILAGSIVQLPLEEARRAINLKIGIRADGIDV